MQYLLTAEEMKSLRDQAAASKALPTKEALQKFCTYVADNLVLTEGWRKGTAWGCILTNNDSHGEWYCDDCPAHEVCPYEDKSWSK